MDALRSPGDLVVARFNYNRTPGASHTTWRFGVAHRGPDTPWFGFWPCYASRAEAEGSAAWYRAYDPRHEVTIVVFPPEPPAFAFRMEVA